ncbi:MAG: hypothetical protein HOP19_17570 [Acidobacteria bacterium]|nr:hypothetical protein [Acidobacteriota bacterium]
MTLILSQASRCFALQVTDRLVTANGKPFDSISNKNLLYFAPDAVVSIGYTGAAYIDGTPTDWWLAEALTGIHYNDRNKPPSMQTGRVPRWLRIGPAIEFLSKELAAAFARPTMKRDARNMMFELVFTGWQWARRKRSRPIMIGVCKERSQPDLQVWRAPRHFGRQFYFSGTPENNLKTIDIDAMRGRLRSIGSIEFDKAETILVDTVRLVAESTRSGSKSYVGKDCMSILMLPPEFAQVRVRYLSAKIAQLAIVPKSSPQDASVLPAAFTPWVIGSDMVLSPSVISGAFTASLNGFQVELEAPEPIGSGFQGAMGGVQRPQEPR